MSGYPTRLEEADLSVRIQVSRGPQAVRTTNLIPFRTQFGPDSDILSGQLPKLEPHNAKRGRLEELCHLNTAIWHPTDPESNQICRKQTGEGIRILFRNPRVTHSRPFGDSWGAVNNTPLAPEKMVTAVLRFESLSTHISARA